MLRLSYHKQHGHHIQHEADRNVEHELRRKDSPDLRGGFSDTLYGIELTERKRREKAIERRAEVRGERQFEREEDNKVKEDRK